MAERFGHEPTAEAEWQPIAQEMSQRYLAMQESLASQRAREHFAPHTVAWWAEAEERYQRHFRGQQFACRIDCVRRGCIGIRLLRKRVANSGEEGEAALREAGAWGIGDDAKNAVTD